MLLTRAIRKMAARRYSIKISLPSWKDEHSPIQQYTHAGFETRKIMMSSSAKFCARAKQPCARDLIRQYHRAI
jgi:hypothetical protein